jgi:hypothetical protein
MFGAMNNQHQSNQFTTLFSLFEVVPVDKYHFNVVKYMNSLQECL